MNKLKTAMLVSGAVVTAGATSLGALSATSAFATDNTQASADSSEKPKDWGKEYDAALTDAFTSKFNLNKSDVQSLIMQVREEQMQKREDQKYNLLKKALSDGKISQAQYDHIVGALKSIDSLRASLKDQSKADRAKTMKEIKAEFDDLKSYVKDQKLSWDTLGLHRHDGGHHGGWNHRNDDK